MMGDMTGITPPCMNWSSSDPPSAFRSFQHYCELIFDGPLTKKTDQEKITYALLWLGQEGIRIYKAWSIEFKTVKELFEAFSKHFQPKTNFRLERFRLQKFQQESGETVDDFMSRCRTQVQKCKFSEQSEINDRLIEQLILGTRHKKVQEVLLSKDEKLSLDTALDIARTQEATEADMRSLRNHGNQAVNIDAVTQGRYQSRCGSCNLSHPPRKCPAYGTTCKECGRPNHWAVACRSKKPRQPWRGKNPQPPRGKPKFHDQHGGSPKGKRLHEMTQQTPNQDDLQDDLQDDFETLHFEYISINEISTTEAFAEIDIQLKPNKPAILKAKVDTGAEGNILPLRLYRQMYPDKIDVSGSPKKGVLQPNTTVITAYNQTIIPNLGTHTLHCAHKQAEVEAEFYVVDNSGPAIIGLPTLVDLGLVTLNCSIETVNTPCTIKDEGHLRELYPSRFEGIGNFKGEHHIVIDKEVPPVVHPARRCPISIKDEIKKEIDQMVELDVITPVQEPTDWVSSLVYTQKPNGRWRICLDPRDLNKAIKRSHMPTQTLDEVRHKFNGATIFSTLDAKHGYWSVKLDQESSKLTTFNSPFGRYRFKRLPFGLCISQDIFQAKMTQILEGCPGVIGLADDIAVIGRTEEEHDANLHNLMQVATQHGLVFNWEKCQIKRDRIRFFGLVFDKHGAHPDAQRVTAMRAIEPPRSKKELQEFLGIATYMSPFIPNLSALTEPLRNLLKKDRVFAWSPSHQKAFQKTKDAICRDVTLAYFDPRKEVVLEVDASTQGLGAALMQEGQPIAFASKSLTDAESRYANIEREMLAVVYACEKFHAYVYGREFTVLSDHKPLEMITLKNLGSAPPRLQRFLLRLQGYNMKVKYKPGKEMLLSDAMSRLNPLPDESNEPHIQINFVMFSDQKLQEIQTSTSQDTELCALRDVILEGWPEERREVHQSLRKYWPFRDELSIENGIILKGPRIIIPQRLREEYLHKVHEAHQGVTKCQLRAKASIFWQGINKDIEELVNKCSICQKYGNAQTPETLRPHELSSRPWQTIAADLFMFGGAEYLLVADTYSKFPIVRKMTGHPTSATIITALKEMFSEHGTPEKLISDNGPQFSSAVFEAFSKEWNFKHVTSSPRYPQSNGFIERQVKTVKAAMEKAKDADADPSKALQYLRATPIDAHLPSPSELLLGRKIRTNLPSKITNQLPEKDAIYQRLQTRQDEQKKYFDKLHPNNLPPLQEGQQIRVQNQETGKWVRGRITNRRPEPRSYELETESGQILRRNRRHIRGTEEEEIRPQEHGHTYHDKHNHNTPTAHSEEQTSEQSNTQTHGQPYTTRFGRKVQTPQRYSDYKM